MRISGGIPSPTRLARYPPPPNSAAPTMSPVILATAWASRLRPTMRASSTSVGLPCNSCSSQPVNRRSEPRKDRRPSSAAAARSTSSSSLRAGRGTTATIAHSRPSPPAMPKTMISRFMGLWRAPARTTNRCRWSPHPTASRIGTPDSDSFNTQKTLPKISTPTTSRTTWPIVDPNGSKKPRLNTNMNPTEMSVTKRMAVTCVHARLLATSLRRRISTSLRMPRAVLSNASVTRAPESQAIFMPSTRRSANGERISAANQSRAWGSPSVRARAAMLVTAGTQAGRGVRRRQRDRLEQRTAGTDQVAHLLGPLGVGLDLVGGRQALLRRLHHEWPPRSPPWHPGGSPQASPSCTSRPGRARSRAPAAASGRPAPCGPRRACPWRGTCAGAPAPRPSAACAGNPAQS